MEFYPAYCFPYSSTFNAWAKLWIADIQTVLTRHRDFPEPSLFFYKNHPIRFIRVTGVITAVDRYEERCLFTLDDSSGATLDVIVDLDKPKLAEPLTINSSCTVLHGKSKKGLSIDLGKIRIGNVVKIKAILNYYAARASIQANLEIIELVKHTSEEISHWNDTLLFKKRHVAVPWKLSPKTIKKALDKANEASVKDSEYTFSNLDESVHPAIIQPQLTEAESDARDKRRIQQQRDREAREAYFAAHTKQLEERKKARTLASAEENNFVSDHGTSHTNKQTLSRTTSVTDGDSANQSSVMDPSEALKVARIKQRQADREERERIYQRLVRAAQERDLSLSQTKESRSRTPCKEVTGNQQTHPHFGSQETAPQSQQEVHCLTIENAQQRNCAAAEKLRAEKKLKYEDYIREKREKRERRSQAREIARRGTDSAVRVTNAKVDLG